MNRTTRTAIAAILLLLATATAATAAEPAGMTLNDCLLYAREHAPANRLNRYATEAAAADRRIAAAGLMPYLGLSASGNMSFGRNIDPETNMYDNNRTVATAFGLSLSLPLFDGLVSINTLKAAGAAMRREAGRARAEEDELSMEVIRAFYNASYCRAMVTSMEQQLQRDRAQLDATLRGEQTGTKSGADVAEVRAIVATDEYELTNQRNLLAKAHLELRSLMGMPPDAAPLLLVEEVDDDTPADSFGVNPRITEAQLAVRESEYALRAARGAYSPRISLTGSVTTSYFKMPGTPAPDFGRQWRDNMGQYVGITLSLPLFDGLATPARVRKARIELESRRTRLEQVRCDVENLRLRALLDLAAARDELLAAERRLDAEQAAYGATRRKYELGSASAIDLYTAGARLATAGANLEGKRIQLKISEITAGYYQGRKLIKD